MYNILRSVNGWTFRNLQNIKHKKQRNDAAKGKIFTKLGRELAVAVKEGGPDRILTAD